MWYLNRGNRLDMNVQEAWNSGATGKGISVTILDDGIERSHPDLVANYDPLASFDVNQNDNDPTPRYDLIDSNRHGTRCAGEASDFTIFSSQVLKFSFSEKATKELLRKSADLSKQLEDNC